MTLQLARHDKSVRNTWRWSRANNTPTFTFKYFSGIGIIRTLTKIAYRYRNIPHLCLVCIHTHTYTHLFAYTYIYTATDLISAFCFWISSQTATFLVCCSTVGFRMHSQTAPENCNHQLLGCPKPTSDLRKSKTSNVGVEVRATPLRWNAITCASRDFGLPT